jgi:hypothetical protein
LDGLNQAHELIPNSSAARKPKERRIARAEVDIAEVAQRELELREHLIFGVRMFAGLKVLKLLRHGAALGAGRHVSDFEFAMTEGAVRFLHDR